MTSQKRYRHHQDSNSNSARFRDLPPRFKRQKSSSSPPPPSSSPDSCKPGTDSQNADSQKSTIMAPSISNVYHLEEHVADQQRSIVDNLQIPQTAMSNPISYSQSAMLNLNPSFVMSSPAAHPKAVMSNPPTHPKAVRSNPTTHPKVVMPSPATWKWQQKTEGFLASSPWTNTSHASLDFQQPTHIPLGTHFGYQINNAPLSPWASKETTNLTGQRGISDRSIWTPEVSNSFAGQEINYNLGYLDSSENRPSRQQSPGAIWSMPPSQFEHYQTTSSQIKSPTSPLPTNPNEKQKRSKVTEKNSKERVIEKCNNNNTRVIDYTDPDIRTIEMLRELERVADQKESENEGFGADRKSLVSHHLRMLMCAVDRYTEGIEDELAMTSRPDEVAHSTSRGSTPGMPPDLCNSLAHNAITQNPGDKLEPYATLQSQSNKIPPVWIESVYHAKTYTEASNHESFCASSLTPPLSGERESVGQETAAWDLWSSQTFDFCGVLMNHISEHSKGQEARKPLYQRQQQHF